MYSALVTIMIIAFSIDSYPTLNRKGKRETSRRQRKNVFFNAAKQDRMHNPYLRFAIFYNFYYDNE